MSRPWLIAQSFAVPGVLTLFTLGRFNWILTLSAVLIGGLIFLVDVGRPNQTLLRFVLVRLAAAALLIALADLLPQTFDGSWWNWLGSSGLSYYFAIECIVAGLIIDLQTGGTFIRLFANRFQSDLTQMTGLKDGGLYIGVMERALIMLLIMIDQPAGIGFLIAAKSILRFGDVKNSEDRKNTEYIIIGTFMSFGWGLFLVDPYEGAAVKHWVP